MLQSSLESLRELSLSELIFEADKVRQQYIGDKFELCSIFNAKSGLCRQDCKFCAQSLHYSTISQRFPLKNKEEILKYALYAKEIGAERIGIVTSGNCLSSLELRVIADAANEIKNKIGIKVCASLGALKKSELRDLKQAGLSRYHHNIETSPGFYPQIVSTHTFQERIDTIISAKEAGLEVCSGGIIGMGETWQDRIAMANILKELDVDCVPINILVPIKGTPLESAVPLSCRDIIRTIGIFRIILKDKTIKIAAGRETALKDFQGLGFMAGANGMLIGGYLTVKGRDVKEDTMFIKEIKEIWKG